MKFAPLGQGSETPGEICKALNRLDFKICSQEKVWVGLSLLDLASWEQTQDTCGYPN